MSNARFYSNLKASTLPLADLLQEESFAALPRDWHVVIADIKNSTAAAEQGGQADVNLVAAGALIACLNIAREHDLEIPFFFGGDGGTLIVPQEVLSETLAALQLHCENTEKNFGLSMHIGAVPLAAIYDAGHYISLAKTRLGKGFSKAVLVGDGLLWAERRVKAKSLGVELPQNDKALLNLMGLECRWDRIKPPQPESEIVCYLIEAADPAAQLTVYRQVLLKTDEFFGAPERRNPLSLQRLKLMVSTEKIRKEMLVRWGVWKRRYFAVEFFKTALGRLIFRYKLKIADLKGEEYLNQVISNADTLTIDGRINTIISGTPAQRHQFLAYLDVQEAAGTLVYGHHINRESVMTCYIESRDIKHIHFVDGSDGGYTSAARQLKAKLKSAA